MYPIQLGPTDHVIVWALKLGRSSHWIPSSKPSDIWPTITILKEITKKWKVPPISRQWCDPSGGWLGSLENGPSPVPKGQWGALRTLHAIRFTLNQATWTRTCTQKNFQVSWGSERDNQHIQMNAHHFKAHESWLMTTSCEIQELKKSSE